MEKMNLHADIYTEELNDLTQLILASGSPRRKELLESMGLNFDILITNTDEDSIQQEGIGVDLYVQELALLKAAEAAKLLVKNKKAMIISADTVVTLDDKVLGKPKDKTDAFMMLRTLSGREHKVYTGICVMRVKDGKTFCSSLATTVKFKELSNEKIAAYIETLEPLDKAGAYGIQGKGSVLVESIDGDYNNVVGISTSLLADILENEFDYKIF